MSVRALGDHLGGVFVVGGEWDNDWLRGIGSHPQSFQHVRFTAQNRQRPRHPMEELWIAVMENAIQDAGARRKKRRDDVRKWTTSEKFEDWCDFFEVSSSAFRSYLCRLADDADEQWPLSYVQDRLRRGLCAQCKERAVAGASYCEKHREERIAYPKARWAREHPRKIRAPQLRSQRRKARVLRVDPMPTILA